MTIVFIILFKK